VDTNKPIVEVRRSEWGALEVPGAAYKPDTYRRIVIHHTWRPTAAQWRGAVTMRGIQRYHMQTEGWADIGPHLFIAPDGQVFEGRPLGTVGAHCGSPKGTPGVVFGNTGSIGIEVVGDYDTEIPTPALVLKVQHVIEWLRARFNLTDQVRGHFECRARPPKTCPGRHLADALGMGDRWRQAHGGK
jgi:hypothetical protein